MKILLNIEGWVLTPIQVKKIADLRKFTVKNGKHKLLMFLTINIEIMIVCNSN